MTRELTGGCSLLTVKSGCLLIVSSLSFLLRSSQSLISRRLFSVQTRKRCTRSFASWKMKKTWEDLLLKTHLAKGRRRSLLHSEHTSPAIKIPTFYPSCCVLYPFTLDYLFLVLPQLSFSFCIIRNKLRSSRTALYNFRKYLLSFLLNDYWEEVLWRPFEESS